MSTLTDLPNVGNKLAIKLETVGITNENILKEYGSKKTFEILVSQFNDDTCLSMLYAIEGACKGIRWHNLTPETKADLKEFYTLLKK